MKYFVALLALLAFSVQVGPAMSADRTYWNLKRKFKHEQKQVKKTDQEMKKAGEMSKEKTEAK